MASVQGMNGDHFAAKAQIVMDFDDLVLLNDAFVRSRGVRQRNCLCCAVLRFNAFPSLLFHNDGRV
jgi:hypothetical protein